MRNGAKPSKLDRSFDALRLRLLATDFPPLARNDALVIVITARTRGEGTSTVARGLARTFERNGDGRVLLLDVDARGNAEIREKPPEDVTVVRDPKVFAAAAELARTENGRANGSETLALAVEGNPFSASAALGEFFSVLRVRYDVIVVDAGSLDTPAPYFWAENAQKMVLVVDCSRTTRQALERLKSELETSKLKINGVVLNKREFPIPRFFY